MATTPPVTITLHFNTDDYLAIAATPVGLSDNAWATLSEAPSLGLTHDSTSCTLDLSTVKSGDVIIWKGVATQSANLKSGAPKLGIVPIINITDIKFSTPNTYFSAHKLNIEDTGNTYQLTAGDVSSATSDLTYTILFNVSFNFDGTLDPKIKITPPTH